MAITIKKVSTKRELKKFIRFNYELYKENPYSVPDLYDDMLNTFNKTKNAAFEFCEAEYLPMPPGIKKMSVSVGSTSSTTLKYLPDFCKP